MTLQWHHNGGAGISNHQPHDCLLKCLFGRRSKKTSKLHVTGLCERNSPVTGEFPAQMASKVENVSIWWRHHDNGGCLWAPQPELTYWVKILYVRSCIFVNVASSSFIIKIMITLHLKAQNYATPQNKSTLHLNTQAKYELKKATWSTDCSCFS